MISVVGLRTGANLEPWERRISDELASIHKLSSTSLFKATLGQYSSTIDIDGFNNVINDHTLGYAACAHNHTVSAIPFP